MDTISYGFTVVLKNITMEQAITKITEALAEVGFGVLSRIDVSQTLKEKIDADIQPYAILGACHPHLALKALRVEPQIGLLMPCNIVLQKHSDEITISAIDPEKLAQFVEHDETNQVMKEATILLRQALQNVAL